MNITLIDPKGVKRVVPIQHAQAALQAGGQYASAQDKQAAIQYGQQSSQPQSWWDLAKQGLSNAASEFPTGVKEGFQTGYAGVTGGNFTPSASPDAFGSGLGRGVGELVGQGMMAAPPAIAGGLVGGPFGAIVGAGLGAAATTPGGLPERMIAGLTTAALPVGGKLLKAGGKYVGKIPGEIKSLFSKPNPEGALQIAQARHDSLSNTASELFNHARDEMKNRGIDQILPNDVVIGSIEEMMPRTRAHKTLFQQAKQGDPESLHQLQSFLWKKGNKAMHSEDPAISNQGEEMLDLRNRLNEDIQSKLSQQGHTDLVHSYKQGQKLYKELKDTYYDYKKLGKVFNPEIALIPKDLTNYFSENSKAMNDFLKIHPELKNEVNMSLAKRKASESLNKKAITLGTGGGLLYGGSKLSDILDHE